MEIKNAPRGALRRRFRAALALDELCVGAIREFGGEPKELTVSVIDKLNSVAEKRVALTEKLEKTADELLAKYSALDDELEEAAHKHVKRMEAERGAVGNLAGAVDRLSNAANDEEPLGNSSGSPANGGG